MVTTASGIELASFVHDAESGTYRARYDRERIPASLAVVAARAAVSNVDANELPPLFQFVDTDALEALTADSDRESDGFELSFAFAGHRVTVYGDGRLRIDDTSAERAGTLDSEVVGR